MPDPNAVTDPTATPVPLPDPNAPPAPALDLSQVKSMLNLPDTASDVELITVLVQVISNLQQKYDALLSDATTLQGQLTNRDLQDFAELIKPENEDFWRSQLLTNREQTLIVLQGMHDAATVIADTTHKPAPVRIPLANRIAAQTKSLVELAGGANAADNNRAVAIRNRAHELTKTEKLPWSEAFQRAEKEITK